MRRLFYFCTICILTKYHTCPIGETGREEKEMAYQRKTEDEYQIVTNYGYGWDVECVESTMEDARRTAKEYRENACNLRGVKIIKKRVKRIAQ